MAKVKLIRTKVPGGSENVVLHGNIINDGDTGIEIQLIEDVESHLKNSDWKAGDKISIPHELIESFI